MCSSVSESPPIYTPIGPSELVLGLTYGAGAETNAFETLLEQSLQRYGYQMETIHLSDHFAEILGEKDFKHERPDATRMLQDMGDQLRASTKSNEFLANLAVFLLVGRRRLLYEEAEREGAEPKDDRRVAWLLRSLKRKEEVEALRRLYGPRFILLGLHVPEPIRLASAKKSWQRWANVTADHFDDEAAADLRRDNHDRRVTYGQDVRKTFAAADFFIDGRDKAALQDTLPRAIRLIFDEPFEPPRAEEQAMYHAFTAGLRSSEMGRQVGAAIINQDGDLLAVGTNDVPAPGGGLYWSPAQHDGRDFAQNPPLDSNTVWQRRIARELLVTMLRTEWLRQERATPLPNDGWDVDEEGIDEFLDSVRDTRFRAITEFGRAVHAEMDAVTIAARNGTAIRGATVACTTFPCHNCTRHLIAAGIRRVLYVLPYAKSLAQDLHDDAIALEPETSDAGKDQLVMEQYIGVAPRVYPQYFNFGENERKDRRGVGMQGPRREDQLPRVLQDGRDFTFDGPTFPATRTTELELDLAAEFERCIQEAELELPTVAKTEKTSS